MATIQDATFSANSTLEVPGECRCLLSSDNVNDSMIINPTSALTGRESIYIEHLEAFANKEAWEKKHSF